MPRLFCAVWPPDEVLDRVAELERPAIDGLRWTDRHQWHVTLRFLGQVPDGQPVIEALAGVASMPPASASLGPATERFDQRILHVPVAGLERLAAAVVQATAHLGRPPEDRPFHGHLTLARVGRRARVDLRPLSRVPVSGAWTVEQVLLVESRPSSSGARYEIVDRFEIGG